MSMSESKKLLIVVQSRAAKLRNEEKNAPPKGARKVKK